MRVSSPRIHRRRRSAAERVARRDAGIFVARSGARLIEALGRIDGEDGLALGCAFRDMVLDPEMPPAAWPVSDVLEALASGDPHIRRRTAGLWTALEALLLRIDASGHGYAVDAAGPAPAGARSAA